MTLFSIEITQFTWSTMSQYGSNLFPDLFSVLVISSSFIDLNEDVWSDCVCVFGLLLMGPVCSPLLLLPLSLPLLPMIPASKAEWQGSGLAKWWNDDPIMRSDSKMRGIRQRLHPFLSPPRRPPAPRCQLRRWWLIRPWWITGSTHWFFSVLSKIFIYSCIHRAYPGSPLYPLFQMGGWYKEDNSASCMTRQTTRNIISEMSQ